ncbi:MAG: serine hydrolase domain-containing protein [Pseudoxanthomonas suwonensis]|nr:serine hydrolase domain-containing protein [Pseudoxanthomonas suwonensis]
MSIARIAPVTFALSLLLAPLAAQAQDPIATVRVGFDRNGVTQVATSGVSDIQTGRAVTADDPVRIASVTKLSVAIGVMRLVEEGKLDLDADINTWLSEPLRNPAFPQTPITLRMLLSHTSSLTDNAGYWNVPLGEKLDTITRQSEAWDREQPPGTFFRYSNLNFPVIAGVMERVTGERMDKLLRRLVFDPLAIDACLGWPTCSDAAVQRAVVLYNLERQPQVDNLKGERRGCPTIAARDRSCDIEAAWKPGDNGAMFSPQGGLRISAMGLARIGRMLLGGGQLDGVRVLSEDSVRLLTTPVWSYDGGNGAIIEEDEPDRGGFFCRYGLAMQHLASGDGKACRDDLFADGRPRVGHSGNAYGLLSGLWVDLDAGTGVAYFATGASNASNGAHSAFSAVEETLAKPLAQP